MKRGLVPILCGLVAVVTWPALARAADATLPPSDAPAADRFALAWVRAPGAERCPSSQELHALLEDTVGPVLVSPPNATVLIDGSVAPEPAGAGHRVLIRATTVDGVPVGERRLESAEPDCKTITRSALLALAVLIDPDAVSQGLPPRVEQAILEAPTRGSVSAEPPPLAPPPSAPGPDLPSDEGERPPQQTLEVTDFGISAYLAANVGLTPSPMLGLALAFRAPFHDAWVLEVAGAFFPSVDVAISGPYAHGTVGFAAAELAPEVCRRVRVPGSFELLPCAGGVAGLRFVTSNVKGFSGAEPQPYVGPLAALDFAWYPTSFGFFGARAQGAFLPQQSRFVYTDHDGSAKVLFDPKPFAAYAGVGAGAAW